METLLAFVFAIGLLVFVHEFGHYWVAKQCGVGVLTFSIGFGKPIYQWRRGETTWQLAMIPLGGFVRMMDDGEAPNGVKYPSAMAFNRKHPLQKMAIAFAGPFANFVFAVAAFAVCYAIGVKTLKPEIATVQVDSVAHNAGFRPGDQVQQVGEQVIESWDQFQMAMFDYAGHQDIKVKVRTEDGISRLLVLPLNQLTADQFDQHLISRLGLSPFATTREIAFVQPGSAADKAGLRIGDQIVAINERSVRNWTEIQDVVAKEGIQPLSLQIKREQATISLSVQPRIDEVEGKPIPRLGISPKSDDAKNQAAQVIVQLSPLDALVVGVNKTYQMSEMTLRMFGKMLLGILSPKQVSGPVGIAQYAGQSASMGWIAYIQFLALISISLAVLNLLPVPILDGGHLLYHGYELISGKPVPQQVMEWLQKIGFTLLLMLMALALFNDANRLLQG